MPSHSITSVTIIKVPTGYGLFDMFKKSKLVIVIQKEQTGSCEIEDKRKNSWGRGVLPFECFHEWLAGLMRGK